MDDNVCIDASLALAWLLPAERNNTIDALFSEWNRKGVRLLTASLFHAEVASTIRKQVYFKKLQPEQGEHLFTLYLRMQIESIGEQEVYNRAWELAKRFNLPTTYDTQYLAVAELRDCELWTNDSRFINSLRGKAPRLKFAGDYGPGAQEI